MSTLIGIRGFNRNQRFSIGDKNVTPSRTTLVNIDNPRVQRDLARHAALASPRTVQTAFKQNDDGVVLAGGKVTNRATGLVLDVSKSQYETASKARRSSAATTATVGTADATNPRVDTIVVNTTNDAVSVIAGAATANADDVNLAGKAAVPASRIVLAYVVVPATATNLTANAVVDARP